MGDRALADMMLCHGEPQPGAPARFAASLRVRVKTDDLKLSERLAADGWSALTLLDPQYPRRIADALCHLAPPVLYWRGNLGLLSGVSVAVIGTRRPSPVSRRAAGAYAAALAGRAVAVASGNAPGVDCEAHAGALRAGGSTIAFAPAPPDRFQSVFDAPVSCGALLVVCAFAPGTAVQPWMFVARNRLVAAQCLSGIVVETGTRGGTLDTVGHLNAMSRPCFVLDLPPDHPRRRAVDLLAAGGAHLLPLRAGEEALDAVLTPPAASRTRQNGQADLFYPEGQ
jgi:DNA processing protein